MLPHVILRGGEGWGGGGEGREEGWGGEGRGVGRGGEGRGEGWGGEERRGKRGREGEGRGEGWVGGVERDGEGEGRGGEGRGEERGQRSIKDLHLATHSPQWLVISWEGEGTVVQTPLGMLPDGISGEGACLTRDGATPRANYNSKGLD